MNRIKLVILFLIMPVVTSLAQKVTLDPTITPALFRYNDQITVTYDVTGTSLAALPAAWIWVWMPDNLAIGAPYDINPASNNPTATDHAKFTKSTPPGKTLFSITFKPSDFFSSDISSQTRLGMLLKGNDWTNGQTTDYLADIWDGSFQVKLTSPTQQPLFVTNGVTIPVQAEAPLAAKFVLSVNGEKLDSIASGTTYSHTLTVSDTSSYYHAVITATAGGNSSTASFDYLIPQASPAQARPAGIIDGINYNAGDHTKATLSFWAPNKSSVYAFGDFSNWSVTPAYLMKKDGEHFWIELTGLTPGTEYAYQYLVNDTLKIADPYSDLILEPEDNQVPASTYPNLKQIPAQALNAEWYYNRFSVLQTGQTPYQWQTVNYQKPAKEKLVIYELLIRDFFDSNHRNFQNLIDTISYFKRLGVNAIELMPITEFNGEIGWGYNPTFMFAHQKYYGTKDKLKEFVDKCHANGIAVIMDLVMNHQDLPNSYAMLDYDFANNHPKSTNKWFNVAAPHPYSVFNDLNHESPYTQKYLDTVNYHWISEFKIDGYRYDLSKGFTQTVSNENTVGNYDQSRINNLQRMANALWSKFPDAYIILEHFAVNSEEMALANYQVDQGRGMMLWSNFNYAYGQNTMGYVSGSDISWMDYGTRGWTAPRAVGYMESHDEERLMYWNLQNGNTSGGYSVKTLSTALQRMKAAATIFYTIPGPKMLWEFGELGYDKSINTCQDGSVNNNCRLDPKPVLWNYADDPDRAALSAHITGLLKLRQNYKVFTTTGNADISSGAASLVQVMTLKNTPYTETPVDSTQMNVVVVANMDVVNQPVTVVFPHASTWYDYYDNGKSLSGSGVSITMAPGTFKLYTDVRIVGTQTVTAIQETAAEITVYPNPAQGQLHVDAKEAIVSLQARPVTGAWLTPNRVGTSIWDISSFSSGLYIVEIRTESGIVRKKLIIR